MPQRWFFDSFVLWLIPQSRREIVWTVFVSWGAGIWRWYHTPHSFTEVGRWTVIFIYLPMLVVVLWRENDCEESVHRLLVAGWFALALLLRFPSFLYRRMRAQ